MSDCEEKVPWVVFRINPDCKKDKCNCCGYFWGPKHPRAGQKATWTKLEQEEKKEDNTGS